MEVADAQPVASSATPNLPPSAVDAAVASGDQSAFREARRQARTGQATPTPVSSVADSTPAAPVVPAASTDASSSPASEPGTPAKRNAETRIQELLRERHATNTRVQALERELAARSTPTPQTTPAAPSPAASRPTESLPDFDVWLTEPGNEGRSFVEYQADLVRRVVAQERHAETQRDAETRAQREQAASLEQYRTRATTFMASKSDYASVIEPIVTVPVSPTTEAMGDVIQRSEVGPQILYHLGTHLEEFEQIRSLPPMQAAYVVGKLEAHLTASTPAVPRKTTSTAPTPPTTLGSRAADPGDEMEAAVRNGDVARFRQLRMEQRRSQQSR